MGNSSKLFLNFRKSKEEAENQKKVAQEYIIKKKQDDKDFYDKIMRNSSQISMEDLQEMFPGDDKIVEKFVKFKQTKGEYVDELNLSQNKSYDNFGMQRINSDNSFQNNSFDYGKNTSFNRSFDKIY